MVNQYSVEQFFDIETMKVKKERIFSDGEMFEGRTRDLISQARIIRAMQESQVLGYIAR
jgi:hypothetical protein